MNQSRIIQPRDAIASANVAIKEATINRVEGALNTTADFHIRTAASPFTGYNVRNAFSVRGAIHAAIYAGRGRQ
jgi:hypothetical protein